MEPELIHASSREPEDVGEFTWDTSVNTGDISYTADGRGAVWSQREPGGVGPRLWVPLQSRSRLHSGDFCWTFEIKDMGQAQIGVGFMLDWTVGPDWGFYGYLGSSSSAWAYDPSSGDVVIATASIEGGLPVLAQGHGTVEVQAHLPRDGRGLARFVVNGCPSRAVALPPGSVLVPAACLLEEQQSVTLSNLQRRELDVADWTKSYQGPTESEPEDAEAVQAPESERGSVPPPPKAGWVSRMLGWFKRS